MPNLDPEAARAILESILTLAGGTVAAFIIAQVIQIAKRIPRVGPILDAGREYVLSLVLAGALIAYAAAATGYVVDLVSGFGLFLAWLGLTGLVGVAHDVTPDPVLKTLGGAQAGAG